MGGELIEIKTKYSNRALIVILLLALGFFFIFIASAESKPQILVKNQNGKTTIIVQIDSEKKYHFEFNNPMNEEKIIVLHRDSPENKSEKKYQGFFTYKPHEKTISFHIDELIYEGTRLKELRKSIEGEYAFDYLE